MQSSEIRNWCVARLSNLLEIPESAINPDQELDSLGLDSVSKAGLVVELEKLAGRQVDPSRIFQQASISDLADMFAGPAA